jgi:hypothetical protein
MTVQGGLYQSCMCKAEGRRVGEADRQLAEAVPKTLNFRKISRSPDASKCAARRPNCQLKSLFVHYALGLSVANKRQH